MKLKILLTLLLISLFATSCGKKTPSSFSQQVMRVNLGDDPVSLDPRVVRTLRDLTLVKQLFEGLMRIDASGDPQPAIAERVDISDDSLIYTFHLREAYWSNRQPVTAYDFEYAWSKVLDPSFKTDYSYMLYPIKNAQLAREGKCSPEAIGVIALDERTLVVQLELPTPYFLELLAFPTYFPVNHRCDISQPNWGSPPGDKLICNGPFCLESWRPQTEIHLKPNPLYWDKDAVELQDLVFTVITDNNTEQLLFEKDALDWLGQPTSHNLGYYQGQIESYPVAGTFWLKFNTNQAPFDQPKIRKAFSYAINRADIITHILQGNQQIATGPLPPSMQLNMTPYFKDGDIEKALELFQEALQENEWSCDSFPQVTLMYPPSERNSKIVQTIQQQWNHTFGIHVELRALENHVYRQNVRQGKYQVGTGEWVADFNDPLAFLELFKYRLEEESGNGMNDTGWQDPTFTQLLEQSLTEKDPGARNALLNQAEEILVENMPIAPLYHYAFDYVKKPYVQGVVLSPLGTADFKSAHVVR